jgi:hypothetical protein
VQKPAARGGQHQREGTQQLREQPPPLPARVIEVRTVPELKLKYVVRARERRPQRRLVNLPDRSPHPPPTRPPASRTIGPAHLHIVRHAPVLPVKRTEEA